MLHAVTYTPTLSTGEVRWTRRRLAGTVAMLMAILATVLLVGAPRADAATKRPVIVVTGLGGTAQDYTMMADRLRGDGYTVDVFELPEHGNGAVHYSAQALATRVDAVLAQTRSDKVSLIGHSLGGLVARDYVRFAGGAAKVDKLITLGTPNQGTYSANGWMILTMGCIGAPSCVQMAVGSTYLASLNAGDDAVGDVQYWTFASQYDEFVYPYRNAFLGTASGHVVNTAVQDQCWNRTLGHIALTTDLAVYSGITQALAGQRNLWLNCWSPTVGAV
jgi:triacylglycerol lipase